jgi:hypothetical protein
MKETIKKVLEKYADTQINLTSEAAREELAEAIYKEVDAHSNGRAMLIVDDAGVDVKTGKYVGG